MDNVPKEGPILPTRPHPVQPPAPAAHSPELPKATISPESEQYKNALITAATADQNLYENIRKGVAKELGIRVSVFDQQVKDARKELAGELSHEDSLPFKEVEPCSDPVMGDALLNEIEIMVGRFIVCSKDAMVTIALWIVMTWFVDVIQVCPLAVITAPEKRCGKTVLLSLIGLLACRPIFASNISPAALYRTIDAWHPTLLIDEVDTFMKHNDELRGVINSGHTRSSAHVVRLVGDNHEPTQFSTWAAKALAGIGSLADTIMDRSIVLALRRKLPHEHVERLRHAEKETFDKLTRRLARFAIDNQEVVKVARPSLPETLNDRAQDNWEPLLAIADAAGGDWPQKARWAALKPSEAEDSTVSVGTDLLADIQEIFAEGGFDRMRTRDLVIALCRDDEKSWSAYNRGKSITSRQVSKRLAGFGIKSKDLRFPHGVFKGYEMKDFVDVCDRYLSPKMVVPCLSFIRRE